VIYCLNFCINFVCHAFSFYFAQLPVTDVAHVEGTGNINRDLSLADGGAKKD